MLQTMEQSSGRALGYRLSGNVTKADYATFSPAVEAVVEQYGSVDLLLDVSEIHWEKPSAWSSDIEFGQEFKGKIGKMAAVSHSKWAKQMAKLTEPFDPKETKTFESLDDAWDWVKT
jgi:hypothetical protein